MTNSDSSDSHVRILHAGHLIRSVMSETLLKGGASSLDSSHVAARQLCPFGTTRMFAGNGKVGQHSPPPDDYVPPVMCDKSVRKYPPGMEPIRCYSMPVLNHVKTPKPRCEEKNEFREAAKTKHYRDKLKKIAAYERALQVSGQILTYRPRKDIPKGVDDPECYNPSKRVASYDPQFTRAECVNPKWSMTKFKDMLELMRAHEAEPGREEMRFSLECDEEGYCEEMEEAILPAGPIAERPSGVIKIDEKCAERQREKENMFFLMTPCCTAKKHKKKICKNDRDKQLSTMLLRKADEYSVWSMLQSAVRGVTNRAFLAVNTFYDKGFLPGLQSPILMESAMTLAEKIRDREYTCVQVIEAFIRRIEEINAQLNCVTYAEFQAARQKAIEYDKILRGPQRPEFTPRKTPLLGIPFCTQENIAINGRHLTAGLRIRWKRIASSDAEVVKQMKRAGAIFLAQTNVSELGLPFETKNILYGKTNNPYDVRRNAGGSAGGAAALISSGGCPIGIGADMLGSMRISASFCGIYAHKPVSYAVMQDGIFPNIPSLRNNLMSIGPMTKHASDLLPLLAVIADPHEPESGRQNWNKRVKLSEITAFYMLSDGNDGKFGAPAVENDLSNAMDHVIKHLVCILKMKVKQARIPAMSGAFEMVMESLVSAESVPVSEELTDRTCRKDIYLELGKKLAGVSDHSYAVILSAIVEDRFRETKDKSHREQLRQAVQDLRRDLTALIGSKGFLMYPTYPFKVPFHGQTNFSWTAFAYSAIFNVLDFPVTQIPIGLSAEGLPLGLQIVTLRGCDHIGFAIATELEKLFCNWHPPCSSGPVPSLPKTRVCDEYLMARLPKNK